MSPFSLLVVWVSMIGAAIATVVNFRASLKFTTWTGNPLTRLALIASATMAALYAVGYLWLLNHPDRGREWSEALRPVGMVAWLIGPWTAFPLALEHQMKKRAQDMKRKTVELLSEVAKDASSVARVDPSSDHLSDGS